MKMWLTKPSIYDVDVQGINRTSIWVGTHPPKFLWAQAIHLGCGDPVELTYSGWSSDGNCDCISGYNFRKAIGGYENIQPLWDVIQSSYNNPVDILDQYEKVRMSLASVPGRPRYFRIPKGGPSSIILPHLHNRTVDKAACDVVEKVGMRWYEMCIEFEVSNSSVVITDVMQIPTVVPSIWWKHIF